MALTRIEVEQTKECLEGFFELIRKPGVDIVLLPDNQENREFVCAAREWKGSEEEDELLAEGEESSTRSGPRISNITLVEYLIHRVGEELPTFELHP